MKNSLRKNVVALFFIAVSIIFLVKLFYIQVLNEEYKFSAKNNVLRYDVLQPVRGLVFDRDSNLIVSNEPAFDINLAPTCSPINAVKFGAHESILSHK